MRREEFIFEPDGKKEIDETAVLINELVSLGGKTGNHLEFKEVGLSGDLSKLLETTIIKAGIAKDLSPDDLEELRNVVGVLTHFITSPIFTDSFGLNHKARGVWEKQSGLRENADNGKISDSAKAYYHANRLGFGRCSAAIGLISHLTDNIVSLDLKSHFQELIKNIPREFLEKDENDNSLYNSLEDAEKIRVVAELSGVVSEVIFFLKA
jgi:hypothetical protein